MVKVIRPLFSDSATGRIGEIGTYRMSRNGPQFMLLAKPTDRQTIRQMQLRACFRAAKKAHSQIPPTEFWNGRRTVYRRVPAWAVFWAQWRAEHPDCQ